MAGLVAYGDSGSDSDQDNEELELPIPNTSGARTTTKVASLEKRADDVLEDAVQKKKWETDEAPMLPAKKRARKTIIALPEMPDNDSDEEEDEPTTKKPILPKKDSMLLSMLPAPKTGAKIQLSAPVFSNKSVPDMEKTTVKSTVSSNTGFVPRTIPKASVESTNSKKIAKPPPSTSSALDDSSDDEEHSAVADFLGVHQSHQPSADFIVAAIDELPIEANYEPSYAASATSSGAHGSKAYSSNSYSEYEHHGEAYDDQFCVDLPVDVRETILADERARNDMQMFKGKKNAPPIEILDVQMDDVLAGSKEQLLKNISEQSARNMIRQKFANNPADAPSGRQRSKHQITYLAYMAKEREGELQDQWAQNRLTKRQTQAKYGF